MTKTYRISIKNASKGDQRQLMFEAYTSRKKAQEIADKINAVDPSREAYVVVK